MSLDKILIFTLLLVVAALAVRPALNLLADLELDYLKRRGRL
jgi:hypothetical protein